MQVFLKITSPTTCIVQHDTNNTKSWTAAAAAVTVSHTIGYSS